MNRIARFPFTLGLVLVFVCLVACQSSGARSNASAADDDRVLHLFDGQTLNGWKIVVGEESINADLATIFSVRNGLLHCSGQPTALLRSVAEYDNYELLLEWRWAPGSAGGNSGLLLHCSTPGARGVWPRCIEAQLKSGSAAGFYLMGEGVALEVENDAARRNGNWIARAAGDESLLGEWNEMRVRCEGDRIRVTLNGVVANEGFASSEQRGAIGLQSEGAEIHFRTVELRLL